MSNDAEVKMMAYTALIRQCARNYEKARAEFLRQADQNPMEAIRYAEKVVRAQSELDLVAQLDSLLGDCLYNALEDGEVDIIAGVKAFEEAKARFVQQATERLLREIGVASSNLYANAVEIDRQQATGVFLTNIGSW